jgi:hypothetical protein
MFREGGKGRGKGREEGKVFLSSLNFTCPCLMLRILVFEYFLVGFLKKKNKKKC